MINLDLNKLKRINLVSLISVCCFILILLFVFNFFVIMSQPGYWHFTDIGAYLSRSMFAIENGFFQEIPYWNYGYEYITFTIYPPLFFLVNTAVHSLTRVLTGFDSIYWSFFATFILSYVFAFVATWKISKKSSLAYLLAVGNFFSLGLLVLMGFNTKIFTFNLLFPAIVYLLDKRESLELNKKNIAVLSVVFAAAFASHFFMFVLFAILYLSVLAQNRKQIVKGLVPLAMIPVLTAPYFVNFALSLGSSLSTNGIEPKLIGLSFNFYTAILVLFVLLFFVTRERVLAVLALLAAAFALNLNGVIPIVNRLETHTATFFLLGIICYYLVNFDLVGKLGLRNRIRLPAWAGRHNVLVAVTLALVLLNFVYFSGRIERTNLFNNPDYKPLLEFGELESVFLVADVEGLDSAISPFVSFQTFKFRNFSVNDWFPAVQSHADFAQDGDALVEAVKAGNCNAFGQLVEKMQLKTIVLKNAPDGFSCGLSLEADLGKFKVFKAV